VENKENPNAPRGPGADRFTRMLRQKAPEKLEDGKHMVYEHALRCFCKLCGRLLDWDCPGDISYTETECCGLRYRLQPRTVIVHIEDVSSRPILPHMEGSNYSDPAFRFSPDQMMGKDNIIEEQVSGPFSEAQSAIGKRLVPKIGVPRPTTYVIPAKAKRSLSDFVMPDGPPQIPQPPVGHPEPITKKKVRRCGTCRKTDHTRKTCPKAD